jgi:hypothetical protein
VSEAPALCALRELSVLIASEVERRPRLLV